MRIIQQEGSAALVASFISHGVDPTSVCTRCAQQASLTLRNLWWQVLLVRVQGCLLFNACPADHVSQIAA